MSLIKNSKGPENASLWVLVGPTASGKTSLAIELAKKVNGEIVSADSLQIYKEFDIGSAKPSNSQLKEIRHHLISTVSPLKVLNAYEYSLMARAAVLDIISRGKQPILTGGSGLYIRAVIDGLLKIEEHSKAPKEALYSDIREKGLPALYEELKKVDPEAASKIHLNDEFRIIRALELFRLTGKTRKESARTGEPFKIGTIIFAGLYLERALLYQRINERVDLMLENGLLEEVRKLTGKYGFEIHPLKALGYSQFIEYFKKNISFEEAVALIKSGTRQYAKRQYVWFKKDTRINWLEAAGAKAELLTAAYKIFTEKK